MATIAISDLHFSGSEFFSDSESYLDEITNQELNSIQGGVALKFVAIKTIVPFPITCPPFPEI